MTIIRRNSLAATARVTGTAPMRRFARWFSLVLFAAVPVVAQDELGLGKMWTFERPPLAYLERECGLRPDAAWWQRMRLASLKLGAGCSASFVSPRGLILTNHHCVRDAIAKVQGAQDWVRDGYVAAAGVDEVRLEGMTVRQLVSMQDVTARVEAEVSENLDDAAAAAQRAANRARILAEAGAATPELQCELVRLFRGAVWQLYCYRVYDDIRLVMAPHLQAAHFGGDPDNFVYPRYAVDFAFCRAYVDGQPADTSAHHFAWSDGPKVGEVVLLTGNPGATSRLLTKAQLDYLRDVRYPRVRELIDNRLAILRGFAARDADHEKALRTSVLALENAQKLYRGEHGALLDGAFMARKEKAEAAFRMRAREHGFGAELAIWDQLAAVAAARAELEAPLRFHSAGGLPVLVRAMAMVEFAADGDQASAQRARDAVCRRDPVRQALFVDHVERAVRWLGDDDPYLAALLDGRTAQQATDQLLSSTRLCDDAAVAAMLAAGPAAVRASDDPALLLARTLVPLAAANRDAQAAIEAREERLGTRLGRLLFALYGDGVSPDATGTLRFSDGRVAGYAYNGTLAPWRTVFHGLFARHAEFDGLHPFDLPAAWLAARDRIDLQAPVDFVCTVDSTGGNSGSPVVNRDLEIVGLLFDGNIESMANEFLYGERVERSVCVHPRGIVEALREVYDARRLLRELGR